ncbi:MAG: hypothetical protein JJE53_01960 [Candidatus Pacebacteria bacterium]|nr:hypothetical protein [Candidatus Paceibacterota bacterium]
MNTMIAYAAETTNVAGIVCGQGITNLTSLINFFTCTLMNAVVPLLVALAVTAFVYGIIKFFLNPDNEEKRKAGKSFMLWGLITLFVMVSIWGLVGILSSSLTPGAKPLIPNLPETQ